MFMALRELEVIVHAGASEHHAVEPLMVLKSCQDNEVERCAIDALCLRKVADRSGDSKMCLHRALLSEL
jgi:hypothetical protein